LAWAQTTLREKRAGRQAVAGGVWPAGPASSERNWDPLSVVTHMHGSPRVHPELHSGRTRFHTLHPELQSMHHNIEHDFTKNLKVVSHYYSELKSFSYRFSNIWEFLKKHFVIFSVQVI